MTDLNNLWEAQALRWLIATESEDFDRWDQFADWLEIDPRHNQAYQRLLEVDRDYQRLIAAAPVGTTPVTAISPAANDIYSSDASTISRRHWLGGAVAASVAVMAGYALWKPSREPYQIITAPGERQMVNLEDGSRIVINGDSHVELDRQLPRFAHLHRGEALFTVVHRDDDPFIVESGGAQLVDAGTAFNVIRSGATLEVAVSEGLVIYNPERENVSLPAGRRLLREDRKARLIVSDIELKQVGSWQAGQLNFTNEPAARVAAALARNIGRQINAAPEISEQPVTGVVQLSGTGRDDVAAIAQLLGFAARRTDEGWVLVAHDADR